VIINRESGCLVAGSNDGAQQSTEPSRKSDNQVWYSFQDTTGASIIMWSVQENLGNHVAYV
jgi:hypothetical protein